MTTTHHEALCGQWAVFFERAGFVYRRRPVTQRLAANRFHTPDFYVERLGFVTVSVDRSNYTDASADEPALVRDEFADFFEFASSREEWCYWLGGAIPFWSLSEVQSTLIDFTFDDFADPTWVHKAEAMHHEWPALYCWYKLRQHGGRRRLPKTANACGGVLARLLGPHFKDGILNYDEFFAFNHKAALVAARSANLGRARQVIDSMSG